jgi:putative ABC transport system permease protein
VVIGGMLGAEKGKVIGDVISLSIGERTEEYIITGFFQSGNNMGRESLLTADGYRLLNPDYKETFLFIDLSQAYDANDFIVYLEQRYGERLYNHQNFRDLIGIQTASILGMINALIVSFNVIAALIIVFILYLVVKTLVLRRKAELGIQKAVGFTTFQLMNQISGSFVPVALLGAFIGSVAGSMSMNFFIGLLFRSIGIMKVDFIIPISLIVIASFIMCLLIYVVSMLVSLRIKNISAYALITE